jgi:hypothetical protein
MKQRTDQTDSVQKTPEPVPAQCGHPNYETEQTVRMLESAGLSFAQLASAHPHLAGPACWLMHCV